MSEPGRILVVDDDPTSRLKLEASVRVLGHEVRAAAGGREGLAALRAGDVDLVLLDLIMPGLDGFGVLREIAADPHLARVPVLVVSAVREGEDIARAIALGAEDVLPKAFDQAILRARVDAAVERGRLRRAEADHLRQIERLGAAAHVLEETGFDPARLGLDALREREGELGRLARVFLDMADGLHRRETAMRHRVALLLGLLLLVGFGLAQGLQPVLSRMLATSPIEPLALAAGSLVVGAGAMWIAASFGSGWRMPSRERLVALAMYGAVSLAIPRVLMLHVATELTAQTISLLIATGPLLVFLATVALGVEARSGRRLLGLLVGFSGILYVILGPGAVMGSPDAEAVLMALLVPVGYAMGTVALATREAEPGANQMLHAAIALSLAAAALCGIAVAAGEVPPREVLLAGGPLVAAFGLVGALATLLMMLTVRVAGAVFASQSGYAATAGGIVWAAAILGEPLTLAVWVALAIILLGIVLVMPRAQEPDLDEALSRSPKLAAAREALDL